MAWAVDANGAWTHTGTTREAVVFVQPTLPRWRIIVRCRKVADKCMVTVYPSANGRDGWEVGVASDAGASTANLTVRQRINNVPQAAAHATAHSIPSDTPFDLILEGENGSFKATASTSGVTPVTLPASGLQSAAPYEDNTGCLIVSDVDGAVVLSVEAENPEAVVAVTNSPLVGMAVSNGGIYFREKGDSTWTLLRAGCFGPDDEISRVEFQGKLLVIAYNPATRVSRAWKVDIAGRAVSEWTAVRGSLPGSTGPGLTTARKVRHLFSRVYLATDTDVHTSAASTFDGVSAEDDWEQDDTERGSAKVYSVGTDGYQGDAILAMHPISSQGMAIFKKSGIFVLYGDPLLGETFQKTLALNCGISGEDAITSGDAGQLWMHTPEGAYLVTEAGVQNLSEDKLKRFLNIGRDQRDAYWINVEYDPRYSIVHYFLTQRVTSPLTPRKFPLLDLRSGEFMLDEYPEEMEPMSACFWDRRVLLGGRDGYVRWLAPFGTSDDGRSFTARYTVPILETPGTAHGMQLRAIGLQLGTQAKFRLDAAAVANGVAVRVYGGETAEDAVLPDRRSLRAGPIMFPIGNATRLLSVADHALAIELQGVGSGFDWFVEECEVKVVPATLRRRRSVPVFADEPSGICKPPLVGGTATPANVPPVANAGGDIEVTSQDASQSATVTLDGSRSSDSDGVIVSYVWTNPDGTVLATTAIADIVLDAGSPLVVTLTVTDDDGATDTDTLTITVNPYVPPNNGDDTGAPGDGDIGTIPGGMNENQFITYGPESPGTTNPPSGV
jgi:hypothetical protein